MDYPRRLRRLRASLAAERLDCLLITNLPNIRYLCGFTGSSGALLVDAEGASFFTDGRYISQARSEVHDARIVIAQKTPLSTAADLLRVRSRKSAPRPVLGIEPNSMSCGVRDQLAGTLRGRVRVRSAPALVERARMTKDASEIRLIRRSVELGAGLFRVALRKIRPGVKELEVAADMEYAARRAGAEGMSFDTIIAAGKRSAVVHGRASQAAIPSRGFVVCDFGVILAGYCSDRTRTVHVGDPPAEGRRIYRAVYEAQMAAISVIRAGVTATEVDDAARNVLRKNKLARYFTHSTGHGLGLEIHEAPRLAAAQSQRLEPGMVVTIEPGAYIPGKWGVRIEDVVVVTVSGCEVLEPRDKELIVI